MNLGIIGYGYVGKAVEFGFKKRNKIFVHDKFLPSLPLDQVVKNSEIIFVAVPTPMDSKYTKIDLSIVDSVIKETVSLAKKLNKKPIITIKSTVVPGTTRKMGKKYSWPEIAFNPEFLTEAHFLEDFVNSDRVVIGADKKEVMQKLVKLYKDTFPKTPLFQTDPSTAEMVKYMANTFLATQTIFANEIFDLCQKLKLDYIDVEKMVRADHRLTKTFLTVTKEKGFGGKCFPKDTVALLGLASEKGIDLSVLRSAWQKNLKIRKIRDWEDIPGAVSKKS